MFITTKAQACISTTRGASVPLTRYIVDKFDIRKNINAQLLIDMFNDISRAPSIAPHRESIEVIVIMVK